MEVHVNASSLGGDGDSGGLLPRGIMGLSVLRFPALSFRFFPVEREMPFKRFVETGRVAFVADGPYRGKLVSIVDVIDQTRALVDGPETGVPRGAMRLNQLHLTKFKINIPFTGRTKVVRRSWVKNKIDEKWAAGVWAQKIEAKRKRRSMTDFDRFKLRKARQIRNKVRTLAYYRLKRRAVKDKIKKSAEKKTKTGQPKQKKEAPKKK